MTHRFNIVRRDAILMVVLRYQFGISVIELMIAIALGLGLTIAAAALFISCRTSYLLHDDSIRLQDSARFAIDAIGRAIAQGSFADAARQAETTFNAIEGADNRTLKSTSPAMQVLVAKAINGSDVLAIHFAGSGDGPNGDGTVTNCAGFGVGAASTNDPVADHGWSIFYVALDQTGEPELYCKYRGQHAWATVAIARGVESFQVLYGISDSGDTVPTRFVSASQIDRLDGTALAAIDTSAPHPATSSPTSLWKKISQVKIALLLRGSVPVQAGLATQSTMLFGDGYAPGASDPGVRFDEAAAPPAARNRLRKLFRASFRFHQAASKPAS